jgi:tripartite-type tricarboxylate transporter receptor subunit TctC
MKRLLLAGLLAVAGIAGASAQDYPNRPITVIVPFPAGGPTDAIIRNLGERMRVAQVGDVPTVDEAGAPGLHMSLWYGFWAPARTPAPIVAKLNAAVQDALGDPAVRERLTGLGMEIPAHERQTPAALVAQQKADIEKWWPVIEAAGIKQQ